MGDHENGLFTGECFDGGHQILFILGVNVCGRLVQDDDWRIFHDGSGDGETLLFSAGEGCAALTDDGIVPVGQAHDKIMAAGFFCRLDDLFHGSVLLAETDIVGDGILKEIHILKDKAEVSHEAVHAVLPHIGAAQTHLTAVHVPESGYQMAKCGLSASAGTHNGCGGPFRDMQGDAVDDFSFIVGKIYIFHIDGIIGGNNVLSTDIHRFQVKDLLSLIHADIHGAEQRRIISGGIQTGINDKGTDHHGDAHHQLHGPLQIKPEGQQAHDNAGHFGHKVLQSHVRDKCFLQEEIRIHIFIDGCV